MERLFTIRSDGWTKTELSPKKILEEQCRYLNEETDGIVIGRVAKKKKKIDLYFETPATDALSTGLWSSAGSGDEKSGKRSARKKEDIQKELGEVGKEGFTYEFFLTSKGTPDYKFRVLFMCYDIAGYPVTIILEEGIAAEIDIFDHGYIYHLKDQHELMDLLRKIFSSDRLMGIVAKLRWSNDEQV